MIAKVPPWISGTIAVGCIVAYLVAAAVALSTGVTWWDPFVLLLLGYPIVGALIVARQPHNLIGWLLLIGGVSIALGQLGAAIVFATLDDDPTFWQEILAWTSSNLFIGGLEGLVLAMAFLFPTGRTLTPNWRLGGVAVGVTMTLLYGFLAIFPGPLNGLFSETPQLTNPFGIPGVDTFSQSLGFLVVPIGLFVILTSLAAIVARVLRSRGIERLQLQWIALAIGLVGVSLIFQVLMQAILPDQLNWMASIAGAIFFISASLGIPAAIGVAILRYHLYDIDRIVNRTLVYSILTFSLLVTYLVAIYMLSNVARAITGESSQIVVVISTLAVAALFRPLLWRIQSTVDRRFYRRKYDAARTLEVFSGRLRDEFDLSSLAGELHHIVSQTMQPEHVSLWVRPVNSTRSSGNDPSH